MVSLLHGLPTILTAGLAGVLSAMCAKREHVRHRRRHSIARLADANVGRVLPALLAMPGLAARDVASALEVPDPTLERWAVQGVPPARAGEVRALGRLAALHFQECPPEVAAFLLTHLLRARTRARREQRCRQVLRDAGPEAARAFARLTRTPDD